MSLLDIFRSKPREPSRRFDHPQSQVSQPSQVISGTQPGQEGEIQHRLGKPAAGTTPKARRKTRDTMDRRANRPRGGARVRTHRTTVRAGTSTRSKRKVNPAKRSNVTRRSPRKRMVR